MKSDTVTDTAMDKVNERTVAVNGGVESVQQTSASAKE